MHLGCQKIPQNSNEMRFQISTETPLAERLLKDDSVLFKGLGILWFALGLLSLKAQLFEFPAPLVCHIN